MICEETRDLLDPYVAGTLDPTQSAAVRAHLDGCAECAADWEATRFMAPRAAALPRQTPVDPALWRGVEQRLQRRPDGIQWRRWLPIAALVLLSVGTGWWMRGLTTREPRVVAQAIDPDVESLRKAVSDLESTLSDPARLSTPVPASFQRDLQALEAAIQEATAALNADPSNQVVRDLYRAAFRRKLEALRQAIVVYVKA